METPSLHRGFGTDGKMIAELFVSLWVTGAREPKLSLLLTILTADGIIVAVLVEHLAVLPWDATSEMPVPSRYLPRLLAFLATAVVEGIMERARISGILMNNPTVL